MSFYLIYIDEFGDSGTRLDDPQQPIFQLQAALVPVEEGNWIEVEQVCTELIREISTTINTGENVRLHMVDLYQRKGIYRKASIEQTFAWIERILQIALDYSVHYVSQEINKFDFLKAFKGNTLTDTKGHTHYKSSVYDLLFPNFLIELDQQLNALDAYGMIIVDQHKGQQFENYSSLDAYRIMRSKGFLKRVVENPIFRDSRIQTLLALPDFSGYIAANLKIDKLFGKSRPRLRDWHSAFVKPQTLQTIIRGTKNGADYPLGWEKASGMLMIAMNYTVKNSSFLQLFDVMESMIDEK